MNVHVAVPPPSDFVDTEAATNVVFDAGDVYARRLDIALELNAAASNDVIVAFGHDADTNGILERAEADLLVGWEGGVCIPRAWIHCRKSVHADWALWHC